VGKDFLAKYIEVIPSIQHISNNDVGIAITDREKYLFYKAGKTLDMKVSPGTPLKPGTAIVRAMEQKRRTTTRGDKTLFGVPYIAIAYPIMDESGEVVGGMVATESVERQDALHQMASIMSDTMNVLASTTEQISAQSEEIAAACNRLVQVVHNSLDRVKETDQVLGLIKNVAGQTNLLGLNAAIEAARAGEHGRGFGVVAEEIRKLSSNTSDSVKKIAAIIATVQTDSFNTAEQLQQMNEVISQVAEAITHIAGTIQQAGETASDLDTLAKSLSRDE
jgi:DNA-binding IclR family transcriptional regulator